jgi:hypothetical protein
MAQQQMMQQQMLEQTAMGAAQRAAPAVAGNIDPDQIRQALEQVSE